MHFENRKDKFFFFKLAKRNDYKEFLLANMVNNPDVWIGDLIDSETANDNFMQWVEASTVFKLCVW